MADQSASWYAMPQGAVRWRFKAILESEWQGFLERIWNSNIPLVFAHVVLTNIMINCRASEFRARILRQMDLW